MYDLFKYIITVLFASLNLYACSSIYGLLRLANKFDSSIGKFSSSLTHQIFIKLELEITNNLSNKLEHPAIWLDSAHLPSHDRHQSVCPKTRNDPYLYSEESTMVQSIKIR